MSEIWYGTIPIIIGLTFWFGIFIGKKATLRIHKREIDAGRDYLKALDEALKEIRMGERIAVGLTVGRASREAASGHAPIGSYEKREQETT